MKIETRSVLASEFLTYAVRDYQESSPLYESLASSVAQDSELLEIASHGRSAIPNLFFGAVHFLLMRSEKEPLGEFYPSLHKPTKTGFDLFPIFRSFCIQQRTELVEILSSRTVQTNEVSRCAYLYPAFDLVATIAGGAPLAMIDVGASAGLHLLWDMYGYDYGLGQIYGNPLSSVRIKSQLRGQTRPRLDETLPKVASRVAIDLSLVSPSAKNDILWLDALIWPEHETRRELFQKAIDILRLKKTNIRFVKGDAAEVLERVLGDIPSDETLCVYQTHIWRQLTAESKWNLMAALEHAGRQRKVFFVSALSQLRLEAFAPSGNRSWTLANYEQHGRWIEWLFEL